MIGDRKNVAMYGFLVASSIATFCGCDGQSSSGSKAKSSSEVTVSTVEETTEKRSTPNGLTSSDTFVVVGGQACVFNAGRLKCDFEGRKWEIDAISIAAYQDNLCWTGLDKHINCIRNNSETSLYGVAEKFWVLDEAVCWLPPGGKALNCSGQESFSNFIKRAMKGVSPKELAAS